jgi:phage-related holin
MTISTVVTSNFGLKAIIAFCLAAMSPHYPILILMLCLISVDFITGIYAAYKTKTKIISSKLKKTIEKFSLYSIAVICAIFFQYIFMEAIPLAKIVAGFISGVELLSIYENIKNITGLDIASKIKGYIANMFAKKP